MRELSNDFDDFTAGNFRESRAQARSLKVGQARVRVGKEAAHLPILRFGRRSAPEKKSKEKGLRDQYTYYSQGRFYFLGNVLER